MKKDEKQTKNKNASTAQVSAQPIASSSAQTFTRDAASTSMDAKLSADKSTPKEGPKSSLTESESDKDVCTTHKSINIAGVQLNWRTAHNLV